MAGNEGQPTLVWLDVDPGHDDAFALMLAGWDERIELLGVSSVAGNVPVECTTRNTLNTLWAAGLSHVPVFKGQDRPLVRPAVHCHEIHGKSGLDGPQFPAHGLETRPQKAVLAMGEAIAAAPRPVTVCATAQLTNVALMLRLFPELLAEKKIAAIVLMGGAMGIGNTGPVAEFNIQNDPEAAKIVFDTDLVTMIPLEVTHTVLATPEVIAQLPAPESKFTQFCRELLLFFQETYDKVFGFPHPPLHDPVAVAYILDPSLFEARRMPVDIETASPLSYGQTVCDTYNLGGREANCTVATAVQVTRLWSELVFPALAKAAAASPL